MKYYRISLDYNESPEIRPVSYRFHAIDTSKIVIDNVKYPIFGVMDENGLKELTTGIRLSDMSSIEDGLKCRVISPVSYKEISKDLIKILYGLKLDQYRSIISNSYAKQNCKKTRKKRV